MHIAGAAASRIRNMRILEFRRKETIMTFEDAAYCNAAENKRAYRAGKKRIAFVFIASCISIALINLCSEPIIWLYRRIYHAFFNGASTDTYYLGFEIVIFSLSLFVPFIIWMLACGERFCNAFPLRPRLTRKPVGYILFVIGICMIVTLVLNLLFPWYNEVFGSEPYEFTEPIDIVLYFLFVALTPAIFEEFAFRGVCITCLRPLGTRFAVVVSAAIFGLMHISPIQCLFAFLFGLLAGAAYVSTGSVWTGVVIHFFNNAISVLAEYGNTPVLVIISIIMYGSMIYSVIYLIRAIRYPRKTPLFVRERQEKLLTGSGYTATRALLTSPFPYVFLLLVGASMIERYFS